MVKIHNYKKFLESQVILEKIRLKSELESMILESAGQKRESIEQRLYKVNFEIDLINEGLWDDFKKWIGNKYHQFVDGLSSLASKIKVPALAVVLLLKSMLTMGAPQTTVPYPQGTQRIEYTISSEKISPEVKDKLVAAGYTAEQISTLENAMSNPEFKKLFDQYSKDNNIQAALDRLGKFEKDQTLGVSYHKTSSEEEVGYYLQKGYHLVDKEIVNDTTYFKGVVDAPDTVITNLNFDSENLFESGKWQVKETALQEISDTLNAVKENGGRIVKAIIVSSTDYQRVSAGTKEALVADNYEGTNKGLSEARNNQIKEVLLENGVSESGIKQEANFKPEVDATIPKGKEKEYQDLRFVKVYLQVVFEDVSPSTAPEVMSVNETPVYTFMKVVKNKITSGWVYGPKTSGKSSFTPCGKAGK
jgi:hypothetical protein